MFAILMWGHFNQKDVSGILEVEAIAIIAEPGGNKKILR